MANIIVATEEQIQEAVFNAVSKFFSGNQQVAPSSDLPDTLSITRIIRSYLKDGLFVDLSTYSGAYPFTFRQLIRV